MEDTSSQDKRSQWKKVAISLLLLSMLVLVCLWTFDSIGASALKRAIDQARAIGGALTLQEVLDARRAWPDDRNGAKVILAIKPSLDARIGKLEKTEKDLSARLPVFGDLRDPELGRRWSAESAQAADSFLESLRTELDAIDGLRAYDGGRFPLVIPEMPVLTDLPHASAIRASVKLKHLQALAAAMRGETATLADNIESMLRISGLLRDEPGMISSLLSVACDALAASTMEQVCAVAMVEPAELKRVQHTFAGHEPYPRMMQAIRSERAFFIAMADYFRRTGTGFRMPLIHGQLMREEAQGIEFFNRLLKQPDPRAILRECQVIDGELGKTPIRFLGPSFSAYTRGMQLHVRAAAEVHCAEVAMAAERFRMDRGNWPRELGELVPAYIDRIPEDPFDPDRPLKKVYREGRLVVYSVGLDNQDDGGDVRRDRADDSQADVGFILLDPARRNLPALPESQPASSTSPALKADWTGSRVLRGSLLFI